MADVLRFHVVLQQFGDRGRQTITVSAEQVQRHHGCLRMSAPWAQGMILIDRGSYSCDVAIRYT